MEELDCPAVWKSLVEQTRDAVHAAGATRVVIGLSGGIDCALVAAIAVEALGAENVLGVRMPSAYSSSGSLIDAAALVQNLSMPLVTVEIEDAYSELHASIANSFSSHDLPRWAKYDDKHSVAEENLQARLRGTILMTISNKTGALVLNTGNRTEGVVGYFTLHGDGVGAFAPIGGLYKTQVFTLAHWVNRDREVIPHSTLTKPPSAELAPGQQDTDSLPPYEELDPALHLLETRMAREPVNVEDTARLLGIPEESVRRAVQLRQKALFKRSHLPPAPSL